jgi:uncharacterized membrane protein
MKGPLSRHSCWLIAVVAVGSTACDNSRPISYAEARSVVNRRCIECHSERNTNRAFPIAPQGVVFDTAQQMKHYADRIEARVVVERTMPIVNMSGMTDEERWILGRWVKTGAKVP